MRELKDVRYIIGTEAERPAQAPPGTVIYEIEDTDKKYRGEAGQWIEYTPVDREARRLDAERLLALKAEWLTATTAVAKLAVLAKALKLE